MVGDRLGGRGSVAALLIVVMLAALAVSQSIGRFGETIGVDFYHLWGVPVARRLSDRPLGSPYREGERYYAVLRQHGAAANQPKLNAVQRFWRTPDFTGSPLLYTVTAVVSSDYTFSLTVFRTVQVLSFVAACVLLGFLFRFDPFSLLCLALIFLMGYQPVLSDLRVANVGCLQLAALAGLMGLASVLARLRSFVRRAGLEALLLTGLVAVTLCKPNVVLVSALLALHLAVRHGGRLFAVAAAGAAVGTGLLLLVPCLYFGSWTVWQEWYQFVYGTNPDMLVRPIAHGNYSTPLLASSAVGGSATVIGFVLLALLVASLVVTLVWQRGRLGALDAARAAARRFLDDPRPPVATGVVLTAATSPLFWAHYHVLLILPSLWLLDMASPRAVPLLAAASVVMTAGVAGMLLWAIGWTDAMPVTIILGWIPLWAALLIRLRRPEPRRQEAPAGETAAPARPRRRRK